MKRIGIISDTHGTFDDTLREFLKDVDEIWHAGDIGSLELADTIASFKPLRAVTTRAQRQRYRRCIPNSSSPGIRISSRWSTIRFTTCCMSTRAQPANTVSTKSARPCGW